MPYYYHPKSDCVFEALRHPGGEAVEVDASTFLELRNKHRPRKEKSVTETFDADAITDQFLKIRRAKARMKKKFDADYAIFTLEEDRLEGLMKAFLESVNLKSAPCASGVFYKSKRVKPSCSNWTAFYEWIKENDAFEFLHKRITADQVETYMEAHKEDSDGGLPPGISVITDYKIIVRTANGEE